jgi:hypothetical protein
MLSSGVEEYQLQTAAKWPGIRELNRNREDIIEMLLSGTICQPSAGR